MSGPLSGLLFGALFGVLIQRSRVTRYERQVGCLRLLDMTIVKFMLTAVLTGMVGVYLLKEGGVDRIMVLPTVLGANAVGGFIFGLGWPLLGYCPGTAFGRSARPVRRLLGDARDALRRGVLRGDLSGPGGQPARLGVPRPLTLRSSCG